MKTKHNTSIDFFGIHYEFFSTVRFYMTDRKEYLSKINALFRVFRDQDLCRIEDSKKVLSFKRDVLAIVAKYAREEYQLELASGGCLYAMDTVACNCVTAIERYIDGWWNCGATVEFCGMY